MFYSCLLRCDKPQSHTVWSGMVSHGSLSKQKILNSVNLRMLLFADPSEQTGEHIFILQTVTTSLMSYCKEAVLKLTRN